MKFFEYLRNIDFFGKQPEFYIKSKPKQVTLMGRILTISFIIIYITIFGYKIYRMSKRFDITFYDSYLITDNIPTINLTNENFYLLLTISNDLGLPFLDESIYYPVAYFMDEVIEEIKLERCDINKIGSKYKHLFADYDLENSSKYSINSFFNRIIIIKRSN